MSSPTDFGQRTMNRTNAIAAVIEIRGISVSRAMALASVTGLTTKTGKTTQ
jgi:hypothetical protein